jgi:uncharacterized protein YcbK (DUF882 family)
LLLLFSSALTAALPLTGRAAAAPEPPADVSIAGSALGWSGAVQVRVALPGSIVDLPLDWSGERPQDAGWRWIPTHGTPGAPTGGPLSEDRAPAPSQPGSYALEVIWAEGARTFDAFTLLVQVPLEHRRNGRIGAYYIGRFPTEGEDRRDRYRAPAGLIEVTPENQDLRLSEHFTLREFLTHDQQDVWPKYVVVDPRMLDKLELVMDDLEAHGIPADRMIVMSGFRTPQYNARGLDNGRADLSRHQYGDAADVWIDNDGDWYMDDLNGDGRRDTRDARVMLAAVERVERANPEMIGGAGVYRDNGAHGPFIHIDVRGRRARW